MNFSALFLQLHRPFGKCKIDYFYNGSGAAVLEENNYYPFGLKHEGYNILNGNPAYKYQYNGKELQQETGWSDYGTRMYMADIGRWGVIDPLAETSRRWAAYNYAFDNPVNFIDPDGKRAVAPSSPAESFYAPGGMLDYYSHGGTGSRASIAAWMGQEDPLTSDDMMTGGGVFEKEPDIRDSPEYQEAMNMIYTPDFGQFDFSKFGDDPTPKRKYLKDQTNAYFGAIESVKQYQLDHSNWVDEYQGTMDLLGSMKEYFDSAGDHLGGAGYGTFAIDNLKTIKEVVEKFKNYNPSLASAAGFIAGTVGTSLKMEGNRFDQIMDIYKNVEYRYNQLHKKNLELHKGVTINVNVVIGTNGGGYTNIMIYDISTHRYLSGGKIVHRN